MEFIIKLLVTIIVVLLGYIFYLRMFKYAFLLMCGNDKDGLSNLLNTYNPYRLYIPNRNIPLSIILERKNIDMKFFNSNRLFSSINNSLSKYTELNSGYEYLSGIEKEIDLKLKKLSNSAGYLIKNKYSEKIYYIKIVIITRLFGAFNIIKPGSKLDEWNDALVKFSHFKDDSVMKRFYISICNARLSGNGMKTIENNELSFIELEQYLKNKSVNESEDYICNIFPSWYKKPR